MDQDEMFLLMFAIIVSPIFLMGFIFSLVEMTGLVKDIIDFFKTRKPYVHRPDSTHYNEHTYL